MDFGKYRAALTNGTVVDEIETHFKGWKPVTYDVGRQLKAIEAFEGQAVKSAEETKGRVDEEVRALEKTLGNIETARPFDELTVVSSFGSSPIIACLGRCFRKVLFVADLGDVG